jgi:chromatin segregation and condensation protein Rec8/ScpA/Scc1 (kleisin family)
MYVLPVAAWVLQSKAQVISPREAMAGLEGRADRTRVIEALAKLTELGPLRELPREARRNAPRVFERVEDPYWGLAQAYIDELEMPGPIADGSVDLGGDAGARLDP